jgi:hypothetical protein
LIFAACSRNEETNIDPSDPNQKRKKDKNFNTKTKKDEGKGIRNIVATRTARVNLIETRSTLHLLL